jgi:hypothetical protein
LAASVGAAGLQSSALRSSSVDRVIRGARSPPAGIRRTLFFGSKSRFLPEGVTSQRTGAIIANDRGYLPCSMPASDDLKRCTKCGEEKPPAEFSRDRSRKDGRAPHCKACVRRWQQANAEHMADYHRRWQRTNRERKRAQDRRYWERKRQDPEYRERRRTNDRRYRERRAQDPDYRERRRANNRRYRERRRARLSEAPSEANDG